MLESKELLAGDTFDSIEADYNAAISVATTDYQMAENPAEATWQMTASGVV